MADEHDELLEKILRDCAAAEPNPLYPSELSRATGVPRQAIDDSLDRLRLAGLVQLTTWMHEKGQGYKLTLQGAEVLKTPRMLGRLRQGDIPQARPDPVEPTRSRHALEGTRSEAVRAALLNDSQPFVTQTLLVLTILWFFVGLWYYTAQLGGSAFAYLNDTQGQRDAIKLTAAYRETGSLFIVSVLDRQQWWRLLTYGLLHGGLMHLGMNMYGLYVLGPLLEKMWGHVGFLAIYLLSCIGGAVASLIFTPPANLVGASGALCGLLGSMATWVFLNRNHLPPHIVTAWRSNILINVILIAFISFMPGISLAAHAGGGITGAVISAPLCMARFGTGARRWLGWAAAVAIVVVGLCLAYPPVKSFERSPDMVALRQLDDFLQRLDHGRGRNPDPKGAISRPK